MIENSYKKFLGANILSIFQRKCVRAMVSRCLVIENSQQFDDFRSQTVKFDRKSPSVCECCFTCAKRGIGAATVDLGLPGWVAHCTFVIRQSRLAQVSVINLNRAAEDVFDFNSLFWSPWSRTVCDRGVSSVRMNFLSLVLSLSSF